MGGQTAQPVHLGLKKGSVFIKCGLILYGIRDTANNVLDMLVEKVIIIPAEPSGWSTSTMNPLRADGKTQSLWRLPPDTEFLAITTELYHQRS